MDETDGVVPTGSSVPSGVSCDPEGEGPEDNVGGTGGGMLNDGVSDLAESSD